MPQPAEHIGFSYPIDVWDAMQIVASVPKLGGRSAYAISYRSAFNDTYAWLEKHTILGMDQVFCQVKMPKQIITDFLRGKELYHVHQRTTAPDGSELAEREQAQVDAYAKLFDLMRDEL